MAWEFAGRSLLQVPAEPDIKPPVTFNNTVGKPCILLWADQLNVSYNGGNFFDLGSLTFNDSVTLDGSFCNETFSKWAFYLEVNRIMLFLFCDKTFRWWYIFCSRLVLKYQNVLNFHSFQLRWICSLVLSVKFSVVIFVSQIETYVVVKHLWLNFQLLDAQDLLPCVGS